MHDKYDEYELTARDVEDLLRKLTVEQRMALVEYWGGYLSIQDPDTFWAGIEGAASGEFNFD